MEMIAALALPVADTSQIAEARRLTVGMANRLGFGEADTGRVAIVVTELATNLIKHGGGGEILARALGGDGARGVEVMALDRGPGLANPAEALRDGYSTSGSPGTGLGAVSRLAALFDIHSQAGVGTAVLAHLWPLALRGRYPTAALDVGAVSVPISGEDVCGDTWGIEWRPDGAVIVLADGLGHGMAAASASAEVVQVLRHEPGLPPEEVLRTAHAALRGTRGAAVSVAEVDLRRQIVRFAGVGNVAGSVLTPNGDRKMVSHPGIVGHQVRRVQEFSYPFPPGALLVVYSDGLHSNWDIDRYTGLASHHPGLIAGVLYRDHKRARDDVAVVVARQTSVADQAGGAL
jgi:anti-sigma regulatory factor (Ser/Thr protein kinase)